MDPTTIGTRGNQTELNYTKATLAYNGNSTLTLTETKTYIVEKNLDNIVPTPLILCVVEKQDALGDTYALVSGATATQDNQGNYMVNAGTEAFRIRHDGQVELKNGLTFYHNGISYDGAWGADSEKN